MTSQELHVVFGTGPVGKWTMRELVKQGKAVRMVNRSGRATGVPAEVEVVQGDAYQVETVKALTRGAASVYQCAQPPYTDWGDKFPPLQDAILKGTAANGAKLIVADNLYMYAPPNGKPLTEDHPYTPTAKKGQVRARMAQAVLDAQARGEVRAAIARASDFFGPDDPIMADQVFYPALQGKRVSLLGRTDQPHTFSYVADFGKALAILGTDDRALGQVWHTPSAAPVTQAEFVRLVEEEVGRPVKTQVAGGLMLRVLGVFVPVLREFPEMLYEWQQPFIMDSYKFETTFGVQPTPLREAVRATVAWCRAHPPVSH